MKTYISKFVPYLTSLCILLFLCCFFLAPQLSGDVLVPGDHVQNIGMMQETHQYFEKTGEITRWSNSMFSGMPTYLFYGGVKPGLLNYINFFLMFRSQNSLGYFIYSAFIAYIGLLFWGFGPWLSLIGAIAAAFATPHIGLLEAGHNTKLASAAFAIMVFGGIYRVYKKEYLLGLIAFSLGLTMSIGNSHPQMTYYIMIAAVVYGLCLFFNALRSMQYKHLLLALGIFASSILMSLAANYYYVYTVRGFSKDTMRGGSILQPSTSQDLASDFSRSSTTGLGFEYAMQWSDGWIDLLAMVIPGAVGGSNGEKIASDGEINRLLKSSGYTPHPFLPLYWGELSFTGAPDYAGSIIILLFVLGLFIIKGPVKWGMLAGTGLLILMSLGKNFESFNKFLFEYLPLLNKFRTPNSIHGVIAFLIPLFAMYTLAYILNFKENKVELRKQFLMITAGIIAFVILFGLGGGLFYDFSTSGDARYEANFASVLKQARIIYLWNDSWRTLLFLLLGTGLLYYFLKEKIKKNLTIILLGILIFVDLFLVARRYISKEDWRPTGTLLKSIPLRPVDQQILQDPQLYYRVFDLSKDPFQDATSAYYHRLIGGYNPGKLRRYQDMIDFYLSKGDQKVLNMLNMKYLITQKQEGQLNSQAMGNAWYIRNIKTVNSPDEEIKEIANIDPAETALFLEDEFPGYLTVKEFSASGTITLTKYEPNELSYSAQAEGDQLAVFSDVWFGPDKGWQAYIDGQPVDHIRVNYILRALKIPGGTHIIEFKFNPVKVIQSNQWNFWLNNLIGILLLSLLAWWFYQDYSKKKIVVPT